MVINYNNHNNEIQSNNRKEKSVNMTFDMSKKKFQYLDLMAQPLT